MVREVSAVGRHDYRRVDACKPPHPQARLFGNSRIIEDLSSGESHLHPPAFSRRTFMIAGGLAGLGLVFGTDTANASSKIYVPEYLPLTGLGNENEFVEVDPKKTKRLIVIWMDGGFCQFASWDPKPDFPEETRGPFGATSTTCPGTTICDLHPKMAKVMDKVLVVRNVYSTGPAQHFEQSVTSMTGSGEIDTSDRPLHPSLLQKMAKDVLRPKRRPDIPVINSSSGSAPYDVTVPQGTVHIKFTDNPDGFICPYPEPPKIEDLNTLSKLTKVLTKDINSKATDDYERNLEAAIAYYKDPNSKKIPQAFKLNNAPKVLRDMFPKTPFGNACLTALLSAWAGINVSVIHHGYLDHHFDYESETRRTTPPIDEALAPLISLIGDDENIVLAIGSEFGRTPKFNRGNPLNPKDRPGRDHWNQGFSVVFCGGGISGGVHGATDKHDYAIDPLHSTGFLLTAFRLAGYELRKKNTQEAYPVWNLAS